jgi:sulfite exporter TauE/SafE/copper chaperone CopZ
MNEQKQKYLFHVNGMHCKACTLLIDSELKSLAGVLEVKSDLNKHTVEVVGDFGQKSKEDVAEELSLSVKAHGYSITTERQLNKKNWQDFKIAVPLAITFAFLFVILQKIGIIDFINSSSVDYGTAFMVGLAASLSTCMAVVGGLVLSMSATFAKERDKVKPQLMFHIGRIVSFFILGGVIGMVGAAFTLNTTMTFILGLIIGLVMLIMGINLLDVFDFFKKIQPGMPKFIAKNAHGVSKFNHVLTPILVGIATFFLPCGFTQSMQIYTLTTGSFLKGGLTMFLFALGTLPVLALISFSSFSIQKSSKSGIFFKTVGIIVILFALLNIVNSLVIVGVVPPIFNF